jgi:tetratricopeptide (TPR) repeat protein
LPKLGLASFAAHSEALVAFREALKEQTRERVPLGWAMIQNNLGKALSILAQRENGTEHLEAAAVAYREALKERTRERVELDWATTQECLAATLLMAGRRRNDPGILEEALVSIDGALEVYRQVNAEFWQDEAENLRSVILALLDGELPT